MVNKSKTKRVMKSFTPKRANIAQIGGISLELPNFNKGKAPESDKDLTNKKYVDDEISSAIEVNVDEIEMNILLNAFRISINGSLVKFNMVDGIMDEFEDESGVDTGTSTNEDYDATDDYYSPTVGSPVAKATGGTITYDGDYVIHTFTAGGNFEPDSTFDVEYLVVGGGGGGGDDIGGGGGAGGYRTNGAYDFEVTAQIYGITVGAGGAHGVAGSSSIFDTITSTGGGEGSTYTEAGGNGASGGGGGPVEEAGGTSTAYGNNGGIGGPTENEACGGGGGGASAVGQAGASEDPGDGGNGTAFHGTTYAGGGGGGGHNFATPTSSGGSGGGGGGTNTPTASNGTAGTTNTGGGGGGAGWLYSGGAGGSGIVIIRYTGTPGSANSMTLVSNSTEAEANPDNVRMVLMEEDVDAVTINTDLKAYASRDSGANWVQATLVDEGDYGSGKRILEGVADVSGQASDKTMKWKITTENAKNLKLHGVGLLWS